ncbi:hypothetical protein ABPG74_001392 [Tetrahymena malaccensis]
MSLFQNCTQILMEDKFNLGRSECLINQGSPNSVSEFAQNCKNLQSDQCMDIIQFSCNGTVSNYISSNGCKSNSLFTFNFKQNRYIYRLKLTVEMIINSNQQITPTSSFLNINDNLLPYDNKDFQQFCSGGSPFYSNTFNQVIQNINQDYLNISFSALPNYSKSYNTYLKGLFLAVEYCPDNCSSCSSSGCLQCKPGYYLNNQLCVQCNLSCQTQESINQQEQQQLQVLSVQAQQTQQQIQSTLMHTHAKLIQNSVNTENNFQARFYQKYMMQKSTLQRKKTFVKLKVQGDVKQFVKKQNVEEEGGDYDQEEVTIENIQKSELAPAKQFETNTQEKPKIKTKISEEQ